MSREEQMGFHHHSNPKDHLGLVFTYIPWTPRKMKVFNPQYMGYTPKNEGCGFPWILLKFGANAGKPMKNLHDPQLLLFV